MPNRNRYTIMSSGSKCDSFIGKRELLMVSYRSLYMRKLSKKTDKKQLQKKMVRCGKMLSVFLLLGLIGGWIFDQFEHTGAFAEWVQLPNLANSDVELIAVDFSGAYLVDREGLIWECNSREKFCLESENFPVKYKELTEPCDFSSLAFSMFSNHPKNIEKCVQSHIEYADAEGNSIAVIDETGNLWLWDNLRGTFLREEALLIKHLCMGVFISLLIGIIVLYRS